MQHSIYQKEGIKRQKKKCGSEGDGVGGFGDKPRRLWEKQMLA